jgi:hypothetical protein
LLKTEYNSRRRKKVVVLRNADRGSIPLEFWFYSSVPWKSTHYLKILIANAE